MISIDAESLKNEWQSLYGLFANVRSGAVADGHDLRLLLEVAHVADPLLTLQDKGIRLRLSIPDTVLLQHGVPMAWYFTSKVRHS